MSKSHTWFATKNDAETILAWLRDAGAKQLDGQLLEGEWEPDGREFAIHFPSIGPVEYWSDKIIPPQCGDNSPRAKRAILAMIGQQENPGRPQIDVDGSAIAILRLPKLSDGQYWVAGNVEFPTPNLRDVFPDLNRICGRFERFLKTHPIVFDNTKGKDQRGFGEQIASDINHRVFALPEAYRLLKEGAFMIDYLASPKTISDSLRRLHLSRQEKPT